MRWLAVAALSSALAACGNSGGDGSGEPRVDAAAFDLGDASVCTGTNTLFLQRAGGVYRSGSTDARAYTSELIPGGRAVDVQPFPFGDESWGEILACVRDVLAPYDLDITDVDPGPTNHSSVVLTTEATHLGLPSGTSALAPFACGGLENGIAFVFSGSLGDDPVLNCMAAVSEAGHLAGLEHVLNCADAMSERPGCDLADPARRYTDEDSPCGFVGPADCMCGPAEAQNTHQRALARWGACPD